MVIVSHVGMYLSGDSLALLILCWTIGAFGQGLICAMPFGMLADTVDYGEYSSGVRAAGLLTAIGSALCIKGGSGVGAFIPTYIMGSYGYEANAVQTAESLYGITMSFIWVPVVLSIFIAVPMMLYARFEAQEHDIVRALQERAKA